MGRDRAVVERTGHERTGHERTGHERTRDERAIGARRLDAAVLVVVALLGALRLAYPFTGDQALFSVAARELRHGAVLYRDFWDVKQPGIFLFYVAAGALGGFNAVAAHAFELVTLVAFGAFLQRCGRRFVTRTWVASLLPLLVVGLYYATARPIELTQVEALVGVPLFAAVWLAITALDAPRPSARRLLASGLATGIAASLKLVCAPLVLGAWVVVVVVLVRREPRGVRAAARAGGWLLLGLAVPLGAMTAYFAANGVLHEVLRTYFVYTPKTTSIAGRPLSRLVQSVTRFAALGAPVLLLALAGLVSTFRRGWDRWSIAFATWIVLGIAVFLGQHWWAYQMALFLVPVGFFAVRGLDAYASDAARLSRRAAAVVALVLVVSAAPLALSFARSVTTVARHGFGVTGSQRAALADVEEPQYVTARAFARFVRAHDPGDGPVYVLGNPIDLFATGRDQAFATNGWAAEQYDATAWQRITDGFRRARPRVVAIDDASARSMRDRSPGTAAVVADLYCPAHRQAGETWYLLRTADACRPLGS